MRQEPGISYPEPVNHVRIVERTSGSVLAHLVGPLPARRRTVGRQRALPGADCPMPVARTSRLMEYPDFSRRLSTTDFSPWERNEFRSPYCP